MAKILIIEDDKSLVKMYKTKLKIEGFETGVAFDGLEGLEKLKTFSPDLILLDLAMPKMDGFVFLEKLKKEPKWQKTPVVILTNLGQERDVQKAKELGAKDYLIKVNLTPKQVVEKIKKFL